MMGTKRHLRTDQNNQIVASYTYGANVELVSMTRSGKTYYYQTNYRGM